MYQLIHTKEKKFGWMEMGIVVKIHVPIQLFCPGFTLAASPPLASQPT
jgi:hypothetical protein